MQAVTKEKRELEPGTAADAFKIDYKAAARDALNRVQQGHQVIRNLREPSKFTSMHLDTYADYLRQVEPRTESRAVRALSTTGGPRMKKLHGRYVEVCVPYQVMLNIDGISIYTMTYVTTDKDQIGQIYLGQVESDMTL